MLFESHYTIFIAIVDDDTRLVIIGSSFDSTSNNSNLRIQLPISI